MRRILLTLTVVALACVQAMAQRWAVSTNALDYIDFGTLNVEGSVAVARNVALEVGAKYNPWTFGNRNSDNVKQNRQRMFYAGVKWYPWFIFDGWHFDAFGGYREYNIGGIFKQETEEGDAFGGGLAFGYSLPVHKNINVEFGAGFWMGAKVYTVYSCPTCGRIQSNGTKFFILPNMITVGATWVFGKTRYQRSRSNYVEDETSGTGK